MFCKSSNLKSALANKFYFSNLNEIYEFVVHTNCKSTNQQNSNNFLCYVDHKNMVPRNSQSRNTTKNLNIPKSPHHTHIELHETAQGTCTIHLLTNLTTYRMILHISLKILHGSWFYPRRVQDLIKFIAWSLLSCRYACSISTYCLKVP